jgi:hypothetical protein
MIGEVGYGAGTTERERYASALAGLWQSLSTTLARLDAVAADMRSLDGALEKLPVLQNRLHWAGELIAGIEPPAGSERAHAELAVALRHARDSTGEMREALEIEGIAGAWRRVHEWRGSLFNVRLARRRLEAGSAVPEPRSEGISRISRFDWRPAVAVLLVLGGTVAFTAGAVATLWPVWAVGLALVAASFLVFEL